jgi:hypothetical protein
MELQKHSQPFRDLIDAVNSSLGMRFWNLAYSPFVVLFAPIPISIANIEFNEKRIAIDLSCARDTDIQRLELVIFGSDEGGKGTTFRERITKLTRYRNTERVSISEIKPDNESIYLTLKLSYKGELIEDRTAKKQIFVEIPTGVEELREKFMRNT